METAVDEDYDSFFDPDAPKTSDPQGEKVSDYSHKTSDPQGETVSDYDKKTSDPHGSKVYDYAHKKTYYITKAEKLAYFPDKKTSDPQGEKVIDYNKKTSEPQGSKVSDYPDKTTSDPKGSKTYRQDVLDVNEIDPKLVVERPGKRRRLRVTERDFVVRQRRNGLLRRDWRWVDSPPDDLSSGEELLFID